MQRRSFLKALAGLGAAALLPAPAAGQGEQPIVAWEVYIANHRLWRVDGFNVHMTAAIDGLHTVFTVNNHGPVPRAMLELDGQVVYWWIQQQGCVCDSSGMLTITTHQQGWQATIDGNGVPGLCCPGLLP